MNRDQIMSIEVDDKMSIKSHLRTYSYRCWELNNIAHHRLNVLSYIHSHFSALSTQNSHFFVNIYHPQNWKSYITPSHHFYLSYKKHKIHLYPLNINIYLARRVVSSAHCIGLPAPHLSDAFSPPPRRVILSTEKEHLLSRFG